MSVAISCFLLSCAVCSQGVGVSRLLLTTLCEHPSMIQQNSLVVVVFFWQFRVQTVATAMNATGCVDTTPTCTRAYTPFPRAHSTRDHCTCGSRLTRVARYFEHCHLSIMCQSLVSLLWLHLLLVLCQDPQPRRHLWL